MEDIEVCPLPNEPESVLANFKQPRKPACKKRVRFLEPEPKKEKSVCHGLIKFTVNIKKDIPEKFQSVVFHFFYLCILHNVVNLANFLFGMLVIKTLVAIGFNAVYAILSLIYSYLIWFQCAYKTFSTKSKTYFIVFLITFLVQVILSCVQTVGIHNTISVGFLSALEKAFDTKPYTNLTLVIELIIASICGCGAVVDIILILMIFHMYSKIVNFCKQGVQEESIIKPESA